jgi:hypothetical protein
MTTPRGLAAQRAVGDALGVVQPLVSRRDRDGAHERRDARLGPAGAGQGAGQRQAGVVPAAPGRPVPGQERRRGHRPHRGDDLRQFHQFGPVELVPDERLARGVDAGRHHRLAAGAAQLQQVGAVEVGVLFLGVGRRVGDAIPPVAARLRRPAAHPAGRRQQLGRGRDSLGGVEIDVDQAGRRRAQQQPDVKPLSGGEEAVKVIGGRPQPLPGGQRRLLAAEADGDGRRAESKVDGGGAAGVEGGRVGVVGHGGEPRLVRREKDSQRASLPEDRRFGESRFAAGEQMAAGGSGCHPPGPVTCSGAASVAAR